MSTKLRIALLAGLLAFASNLIIIGFIHFQTRDEIVSSLRRQVEDQSAALGKVYRSGGAAALRQEISEATKAGNTQVAVAILDRSGTPVYGNVDAVLSPSSPAFGNMRTAVLRMKGESSFLEASAGVPPIGGGQLRLDGRNPFDKDRKR